MILVIGGTGTIGSEVVKKIAGAGLKARVLVRNAVKAETVQKLGLETALGDVSKIETIEAALRGVDSLFLLTRAHLQMAKIESAIMDAAKKAGVKRIVLFSGMGVSLQSPQTITREHALSQEHLKKLGVPFTVLQPAGFMQNFLFMASTIKQGAIYGNYKNGRMGFVDARDIAAVALAALTGEGHNGKTYVITGGESMSYFEAAEAVSRVIGKTVNYVDVPAEVVIKAMTDMGMPEWLSKDLAKFAGEVAAGELDHITDVVEKVTGRKPITLEQFFIDNVEAFN